MQNICLKIELVNKENEKVEESAEFKKYTCTGETIGLSASFNVPENFLQYYIKISFDNSEGIENIYKVFIE